jgi:hypothetical protein
MQAFLLVIHDQSNKFGDHCSQLKRKAMTESYEQK